MKVKISYQYIYIYIISIKIVFKIGFYEATIYIAHQCIILVYFNKIVFLALIYNKYNTYCNKEALSACSKKGVNLSEHLGKGTK
jgi:hypothetical protein